MCTSLFKYFYAWLLASLYVLNYSSRNSYSQAYIFMNKLVNVFRVRSEYE